MSNRAGNLTTRLLGIDPPRRSRRARWTTLLDDVATRLVERYGRPSLGNYDDPIDEIFYILLSARTAEIKYHRSHAALCARFPRLEDLARADVDDLQACIAEAGLSRKKAGQVKAIAARVVEVLGEDASRKMRDLSAEEAFAFLTSLPGVAEKSALCVMTYSLGWDVFPADVHARRIATRLGILPSGLDHRAAQSLLPAFVPEGRSRELHVGFVVHGREVCRPRNPDCANCLLNDVCRTGRRKVTAKSGS